MECFLQDSFLVSLSQFWTPLPDGNHNKVKHFLGMGGSGFIKEKLGYYGNFSIGIFLIVICILYTVIFLKVSR